MKLFHGVPNLQPFASQESKYPEIEGVAGNWWNCVLGVFFRLFGVNSRRTEMSWFFNNALSCNLENPLFSKVCENIQDYYSNFTCSYGFFWHPVLIAQVHHWGNWVTEFNTWDVVALCVYSWTSPKKVCWHWNKYSDYRTAAQGNHRKLFKTQQNQVAAVEMLSIIMLLQTCLMNC